MRNQQEKIKCQEKYIEEFVWVASIFSLQVLLVTSFLPFFLSVPSFWFTPILSGKFFFCSRKWKGGWYPHWARSVYGPVKSLQLMKNFNHYNRKKQLEEQISTLKEQISSNINKMNDIINIKHQFKEKSHNQSHWKT